MQLLCSMLVHHIISLFATLIYPTSFQIGYTVAMSISFSDTITYDFINLLETLYSFLWFAYL